VYTCASAHAAELGYILSQPIVCIIDVCGLRMGFRALAPEGSRVIYGPGMSVRLPIYWHYDTHARESRTAAPRHIPLFTHLALTAGVDATQAPRNCKARQVRTGKNVTGLISCLIAALASQDIAVAVSMRWCVGDTRADADSEALVQPSSCKVKSNVWLQF
jgi:hypothetical protein